MTNNDVMVVENSLSQYGLRTVHLMRSGKRLTAEDAAKFIPAEVEVVVEGFQNYEDVLDMWDLIFVWNAREVVNVNGERVGLWWINDQRVSWAIDMAATMYRLAVGYWPETAWMQKLPKKATETLKVADSSGEATLQLFSANPGQFAPDGFVIVGGRHA